MIKVSCKRVCKDPLDMKLRMREKVILKDKNQSIVKPIEI